MLLSTTCLLPILPLHVLVVLAGSVCPAHDSKGPEITEGTQSSMANDHTDAVQKPHEKPLDLL